MNPPTNKDQDSHPKNTMPALHGDTIAAIATGKGSGGIGIVKISGPMAFKIAEALFHSRKSQGVNAQAGTISLPKPRDGHRIHHGFILRPKDNSFVDEVLLSVMASPSTYTGEDIVEINCHGGPWVTQSILDLVIQQGARPAEPGEFTKRAFLNGKIDLTQAEAVVDLIESKTRKSLDMAAAHLSGGFAKRIRQAKENVAHLLVHLEAAIDFPDDVQEIMDFSQAAERLQKNVINPLKKLLARHREGEILRDGFKCAVLGKPNVGKSSLMNRLLRSDRVIVTPVPGTTRDLVEENINIGGYPVVLVDTAGIHSTDDPVERIGVQRARIAAEECDLNLFMVDGKNGADSQDDAIFEIARQMKMVMVINKIDLMEDPGGFLPLPNWEGVQTVSISAKTGDGVDDLERVIAGVIEKSHFRKGEETGPAPNVRHCQLLESAIDSVQRLCEQLKNGAYEEVLAIEARDANNALGEILGTKFDEDLLQKIFTRFCLGK